MNNSRRLSVAAAALVLFIGAAVLATSATGPITSRDAFWHLKMGEDLVQSGLSPWRDHYSYTFSEEPIESPPVMFQVLLHGFANVLGIESGFAALKFFSYFACLLALVIWAYRSPQRMVVLSVLAPFLLVLFQLRMIVRPEILTHLFVVVSFVLFERARKDFSFQNLCLIALFLLFWVNYHTPVVGYVVFFGLFVQVAIEHIKAGLPNRGFWAKWCSWGTVLVLLAFLNPGFHHFLLSTLQFEPGWAEAILEYGSASQVLGNLAFFPVFWCMAGLVLVWALGRREFGYALVCAIMLFTAWKLARIVPLAGVVLVCVALVLAGKEEVLLAQFRLVSKVVAGLVCTAVFGVSVYTVKLLLAAYALIYADIQTFPDDVVQYMDATSRTGRVFNQFEIGGYLLYYRAPANRVFIDGRTSILYPFSHYQHYAEIYQEPEAIAEAIDDYEFDLVLDVADVGHLRLWSEHGYQVDFVGERFYLLTKHSAAMALAGTQIIDPACWTGKPLPSVAAELEQVLENMPRESSARTNLEFYRAAFAQENELAAVGSLLPLESLRGDVATRFRARVAAVSGDRQASLQSTLRIRLPTLGDRLAAALDYLVLGQPAQAEIQVLIAAQSGQFGGQLDPVVFSVLRRINDSQGGLRFELLRQLLEAAPEYQITSDEPSLCGV